MAEPVPPRRAAIQRWTARWNGPIFIAIGLCWLYTIAFEPGIVLLRWILGIVFLVIGIVTTVAYIRTRRTQRPPAQQAERNAGP